MLHNTLKRERLVGVEGEKVEGWRVKGWKVEGLESCFNLLTYQPVNLFALKKSNSKPVEPSFFLHPRQSAAVAQLSGFPEHHCKGLEYLGKTAAALARLARQTIAH